jgi:drug/metabolite transporter (DMT)-like permease
MNQQLGVIYGILALLTFGISNAMSKRVSVGLGAKSSVFYRTIFTSLLLLIVLFFSLGDTTFSLKYILVATLIAVVGYVPLFYFYKAVETGQVGVVTPIAFTSVIVTVVLSAIFYNEQLAPARVISILLILSGVIFMSADFRDLKNSSIFDKKSGILYAMIASLGWGLYFFWVKIPVLHLGPVLTSFIVEFTTFIVSFLVLGLSRERARQPGLALYKLVFVIALLGVGGSLAYNLGVRVADTTLVVGIYSASPLVVLLYGRMFYKEKLTAIQYLGALSIVAGVVALSLLA